MGSSQAEELSSRSILRNARRVCIKVGTSVVAKENGRPSLTRLGAITEQIAELHHKGVEVIFVSSGAVGMGKRLLRKQRAPTTVGGIVSGAPPFTSPAKEAACLSQ